MYNAIICRYHEIATKGENRNLFERCLVDNMRRMLSGITDSKVRRVRGRVWIEKSDNAFLGDEELAQITAALSRAAFGLESFSPCRKVAPEMAGVRTASLELLAGKLPAMLAKQPSVRFRVRARRSDKTFELNSNQIEIDLVTEAAKVYGYTAIEVDLTTPELSLGCEIRNEFAVLFFDSFDAPGGLPVGSNPRVLTLLSGGIDSPAAVYLAFKRGSSSDFITFHSSPYTPLETIQKVKGIARYLNTFQATGKLHLCNLAPLQKLIRDHCTERLRTVLYRRAMLRIAEKVAWQNNCKALLTGESLGQVASQTLINMNTINNAIEMLVLRPLVGFDKLETIRLAEKIGTYELSNVQVPDSCTVFAPSSPATSCPIKVAVSEEGKIPDYEQVLDQIIQSIETI